MEFDATAVKEKLAEDRSAVRSRGSGNPAIAGGSVKEGPDLTDAMTAKFDTEKARIDAGERGENIFGHRGRAGQTEACGCGAEKRKRDRREAESGAAAGVSELASKKQKFDQAAYQVELDERSLASLTLQAPAGWRSRAAKNWQPQGSPTAFKPGDGAWPGAGHCGTFRALKIVARVEEAERGQLKLGQSATC